MSELDAAAIVRELMGRGFSQTDIARGLGLMARGSGSYVGQVAKGTKGSNKLGELRGLLDAVRGVESVPQGRAGASERQALLQAAPVQHVPRTRKSGELAAVRKPGVQAHKTKAGHKSIKARIGRQAIESGGAAIASAIEVLSGTHGRFSLLIVGQFAKGNQAAATGIKGSNYKPRYRKGRKSATLRKGSRNVFEGSFANKGKGFESSQWMDIIGQRGTFMGALEFWAEVIGQVPLPDRIDSVELTGTPSPEPWQ